MIHHISGPEAPRGGQFIKEKEQLIRSTAEDLTRPELKLGELILVLVLVVWQRALGVLEKMLSQGSRADVNTYNAAISACGTGKQWQRALDPIGEMHSKGLQANVITYSAAISACEKGNQWQPALEFFRRAELSGVAGRPDHLQRGPWACCWT